METAMGVDKKGNEDFDLKPDLDKWQVKGNLEDDFEKYGQDSDFRSNFTIKWTRIADEWKKSVAKEFAKKKAAEKEKLLTNKQLR